MSRSHLRCATICILVVACLLSCAVDRTLGGRRARVRFPKLVSYSELSLSRCRAATPTKEKAAGTVRIFLNQDGTYNVTYAFLVARGDTTPTLARAVTGGPCNTLSTPTTVLDFPGTWVAGTDRKGRSTYQLSGFVADSTLVAAMRNREYRKKLFPKVFAMVVANATHFEELEYDD